jgi:DNA mismatch endonuclease (patch repair protein)
LDRFDQTTRSRVMSRNKSRGTISTEWRFRSLLMRSGVSGWRVGHDFGLPGRPDFVFVKERIAIFLDGCFWHGCRRCRSIPTSNREFWMAKINGNRKRDKKVVRALRAMDWTAIRIWEHELENDCVRVLQDVLATRSRSQ